MEKSFQRIPSSSHIYIPLTMTRPSGRNRKNSNPSASQTRTDISSNTRHSILSLLVRKQISQIQKTFYPFSIGKKVLITNICTQNLSRKQIYQKYIQDSINSLLVRKQVSHILTTFHSFSIGKKAEITLKPFYLFSIGKKTQITNTKHSIPFLFVRREILPTQSILPFLLVRKQISYTQSFSVFVVRLT